MGSTVTSIDIHVTDRESGSGSGSELGGGLGHMMGFGAAVVAGCLLFAVSRKLTWGVDEPLFDWRIGLLSIAPYFLYAAAANIALYRERMLAFIRATRLPSLWTVSLALYVTMHLTRLARLIEDPIYDAFSLGMTSFALLTVIYVTASFLLVSALAPLLRRRRRAALPNATAFGYALCLLLFLFLVFWIPLQS
jgi:hypothetical protein